VKSEKLFYEFVINMKQNIFSKSVIYVIFFQTYVTLIDLHCLKFVRKFLNTINRRSYMLAKSIETVTVTTINKDNWQEKKRKLIKQYPLLKQAELKYEEGKVEEMINNIHSKIGKTIGKSKKELHKFIEAI